MSPTLSTFPETIDQFNEYAKHFGLRLKEAKTTPPHDVFQWYPYQTMTSLDLLEPLLREHFAVFRTAIKSGKMLDIGCGDGDLSYFFASLGSDITAIDLPSSNFNWMTGVQALHDRLQLPVRIRQMNVDSAFDLEEESYGLILLLGILYHLKNPFQVLETLAKNARYCLLSTRVASHSAAGTLIRDEPLAYLLDHREANDDPTNYWVFSHQGLLRLAKRTGWRVVGARTVGSENSNPVASDADQRMFVFLRSQLCSAPATVKLLDGWYELVAQQWAWTDKKFSFEVRLLEARRPSSFLLGFVVPQTIAAVSPVRIHCSINGLSAGTEEYQGHGDKLFEKSLPAGVDHTQAMLFEFTVEHTFDPRPDIRDLGVIMPFTGAISGIGERILFWVN